LDHYLGFDSISSTSAMLRLLVGAATDDPLLVGDAFRIAREAGEAAFAWAAPLALQFGLAVEHVDSIHVVGATLARTEADRVFGALQLGTSLAVRGRSNEAVKALARAGDDADLLLTLHALYSDLDDDIVREAVEREGQRAAAPPGEARAARRRQGQAACAVGQWKLWHGDADIEGEIERLRAGALSLDPRGYPEADPTCLELLEAMRAVISGQTDAERRVEGLDSLLLTGPPGQREEYNLALASLFDGLGMPGRALAAVRRRSYDWDAAYFVATYLRQEGRLAELTGDRDGAIAAYSHYLKLRAHPEPQLAAQRDSVQAVLDRLTRER
jgi:hypothetical protein